MRLSLLLCIVFGAVIPGCGRKQQSAAVQVQSPDPGQAETEPQTMELRPLSQVIAGRLTHLAVDSLGNIYWVQESPDGQDILFCDGEDLIPRPTGLTTASILAGFDPAQSPSSVPGPSTGPADVGTGNIQSIAIDPDNNLLFFFNGGTGRSTCVGLGRFRLFDRSVHILAGAAVLATAARMGESVALARGQIIAPTSTPRNQPMRDWLWMHHSDAAFFLRFDPRAVETQTAIDLTPAFETLTGEDQPPSLTDDSLRFSPGLEDSLLMIDPRSTRLSRVDGNGVATQWMTLLGLPLEMSAPTILSGGVAISFAPAGEIALPSENDAKGTRDMKVLHIRFPALLALRGDDVTPIVSMEDIEAPPQMDITQIRLTQLTPTNRPNEFIGYDSASGIIMRIRLSPKRDQTGN